jgi:hypothetical protein
MSCDSSTLTPMVCVPATCALADWHTAPNADAARNTSAHFAFMMSFSKKYVGFKTINRNKMVAPGVWRADIALTLTLNRLRSRCFQIRTVSAFT